MLANKKNNNNYTILFAEQDTSSIRKEILGKGFKKKKQKTKIRIVFNDKYKKNIVKNVGTICSNLIVSDNLKLDVQWEVWELYSYAIERKGLKPRDLGRFKKPRDFSIILVFYALKSLGIHKIDNIKVKVKSIFRFLGDHFKKLDLSQNSCRYLIPRKIRPFLLHTLIKDKNEKKQLIMLKENDNLKELNSKYRRRGRTAITYEDCFGIGQEKEDLDFDMIPEEFKEAMYSRGSMPPSQVKLRWRCGINTNHTWNASYNNIKSGKGCPHCRIISYEDCVRLGQEKEDLDFDMTPEEFKEAMYSRGSTPPSEVKLRWRCGINSDHTWNAIYNNIKNLGSGCPYCSKAGKPAITYEDCVEVGQERNDLEFAMTSDEFMSAMDIRGSTPPSQAKLRWRCGININHTWNASYNNIKSDKGCPFCRGITYEDCIGVGQERNDLEFAMTSDEFMSAMDIRGSTPPSQVKLRWRCSIKPDHIWDAKYSDIKFGKGCPYCFERNKVVGTYAHTIFEYFSLKYLKLKNSQGKHEARVDIIRKYQVDLIIKREKNFKNNIEKNQYIVRIPDYIEQIAIDFTFTFEPDYVIAKCYKKYQSRKRFLFIILLGDEKGHSVPRFQQLINETVDIDYKQHIKVITFEEYLIFLNLSLGINNWRVLSKFEKEIVFNLREARNLAIDSLSSDEKFNELIKLSQYYLSLLRKFF